MDCIYSGGWIYHVSNGYAWDIVPSHTLFKTCPHPNKECKTIYVPAEVNYHHKRTFYSAFPNLQELIASPNSKTYKTHDGVLCSHGKILYIPHGKKSFHIDKNVTGVEYGAFDNCHNLEVITLDPENTAFTVVDGCLYDKDMTILYFIPYVKKTYCLPNTVRYIDSFVLKNASLDFLSVDIGNQVFSAENGMLVKNREIIYILPKRTSMSIPAKINHIGCSLSGIETITAAPENENFMAIDDCLFNKSGETLLYFPDNQKKLTVFLHTKISKDNQMHLDNSEWDITVIIEKNKHLTFKASPKKLNFYLQLIRAGKPEIKPGTEYLFLNFYLSGWKLDEQSQVNFKKSAMQILRKIILDDNLDAMKDVLNKTEMVTAKNIRRLIKLTQEAQKTDIEKLLSAYLANRLS